MESFVKETNNIQVNPNDSAMMETRNEVRRLLLRGEVKQAIRRLNDDVGVEVLEENVWLVAELRMLWLIELVRGKCGLDDVDGLFFCDGSFDNTQDTCTNSVKEETIREQNNIKPTMIIRFAREHVAPVIAGLPDTNEEKARLVDHFSKIMAALLVPSVSVNGDTDVHMNSNGNDITDDHEDMKYPEPIRQAISKEHRNRVASLVNRVILESMDGSNGGNRQDCESILPKLMRIYDRVSSG